MSVVTLKNIVLKALLPIVVDTEQCWVLVDTVLPQVLFQVNWAGSHTCKNLISQVSQICSLGCLISYFHTENEVVISLKLEYMRVFDDLYMRVSVR